MTRSLLRFLGRDGGSRLVALSALVAPGLLVLGLAACGGGTGIGGSPDGSALCGNGRLDPGEACDQDRLGGASCVSLGYEGGTLSCTSVCTFDLSGCEGAGPVCGDGVVQGGEACDHPDYGGATCETLGFAGGTLGCLAACIFDVSGCEGAGPVCGDGVAEGAEECDGADLQGMDCTALGLLSGTLRCGADCAFDTSQCEGTAPQCGNGVVEGTEECDGADLQGSDCASLGFTGGTLGCAADCTFETSQCVTTICGNGALEAGEACDGADLGGQTCTSLGFTGGTLACTPGCAFDVSGCAGGCSPTGGPLACADTVSDDTASSPAAVDAIDTWTGAGCHSWSMAGPEIVYTYTPTSDEGVQIDLTGLASDLDLIVLVGDGLGCHAGLPCLRWGGNGNTQPEQVRFTAAAGTTYYVVVDGFNQNAGPFTLTFSCVDVEICSDGIDNDNDGQVDCADPDCAGDPACFVRQVYEQFPTNDPSDEWDLSGTTITFQPSAGAPDGYTFLTQGGVAAYPSPPGSSPSSSTLAFAAKDDSVLVTLPAGRTFPFFGTSYTEVWVNSHGNLTFGAGDLQYEESGAALAAGPPRIAVDWDHLDITQGGTVTVDRWNDRLVVTWDQIADRFYGGVHSFQAELFWTGEIAVTNLAHDGVDGLVGISEGGGSDFRPEVDFYQGTTPVALRGFYELFVPNQGDPLDLDAQELTFTPDAAAPQGYTFQVTAAPATLRFTPGTGNVSTRVLTLGDDAFAPVTLTAPHNVWFYGQTWTAVQVGSNGFVTFGAGSNDFTPTAAEHFAAPPRIAALWTDWTPNTGGTVTVDEHTLSGGYALVVTYENVPRFNNPAGTSTFQLAVFTNGLVRMQYHDVNVTDGLVGIANGVGGTPPAETNFRP